MLVGFISLLLTVFQDPISKICISKEAGDVMLPCHLPKAADYADKGDKGSRRRLLSLFQAEMSHRRSLAAAVADVCAEKVSSLPCARQSKLLFYRLAT
jgi:mlo protein